jgi:hypothetical protein
MSLHDCSYYYYLTKSPLLWYTRLTLIDDCWIHCLLALYTGWPIAISSDYNTNCIIVGLDNNGAPCIFHNEAQAAVPEQSKKDTPSIQIQPTGQLTSINRVSSK